MAKKTVLPKHKADVTVSDAALGAGSTVATKTTAGIVKQAALIADLTAAPTQANFNTLLAALKTAGLMATS